MSIKEHFIAAGFIKMSPYGIFYLTKEAEDIEGDYDELEKIATDLLAEMGDSGYIYNSEERKND